MPEQFAKKISSCGGTTVKLDVFKETGMLCLSTHGGSGYAAGSYWDGDVVVCGICGYRIEKPRPTGGRWVPATGFIDRLRGRGEWIGVYPDFIKPQKK